MAYKILVNGAQVDQINTDKVLSTHVLKDYISHSKQVKDALKGPITGATKIVYSADQVAISGESKGVAESKPATPKLEDVAARKPQVAGKDVVLKKEEKGPAAYTPPVPSGVAPKTEVKGPETK